MDVRVVEEKRNVVKLLLRVSTPPNLSKEIQQTWVKEEGNWFFLPAAKVEGERRLKAIGLVFPGQGWQRHCDLKRAL